MSRARSVGLRGGALRRGEGGGGVTCEGGGCGQIGMGQGERGNQGRVSSGHSYRRNTTDSRTSAARDETPDSRCDKTRRGHQM